MLDNENNFNNGEGAPLFHAFENIVRLNDNMGYDKLMHFVFSAQHTYNEGTKVGYGLGVLKEFFKDEVPSWLNDDIGWDENDMKANQKGIDFGNEWRKNFQKSSGTPALKEKLDEKKNNKE